MTWETALSGTPTAHCSGWKINLKLLVDSEEMLEPITVIPIAAVSDREVLVREFSGVFSRSIILNAMIYNYL
jgi:hypothetical protein